MGWLETCRTSSPSQGNSWSPSSGAHPHVAPSASPQHSRKLGEVNLVWIQTHLSSWEISDESVDDLYDLTSPSTFADSLAPLLVPIIERALNTLTPEANWRSSHANAAWVIGTCMQALSRSGPLPGKREWICPPGRRRSWSIGHGLQKVLIDLVALLEAW